MATLGDLLVRINADASGLQKGLSETDAAVLRVGQGMQNIGTMMSKFLTVPLLAAGTVATKLAADFETSFGKIEGLVGIAGAELDILKASALGMAGEVGRSPNELAEALYFITSAGISGSDAIETLRASAMAAAIGLGDTKTVADLATSAVNAYGSETLTATAAVDVLAAAVREGKLEPAELAGSMGRVLPIASAMGVQFHEVGAALAAMSRTGTDAAEGATQLRGILSSILSPSAGARGALAGVGLSADMLQASLREKGLLPSLEMLAAAFGGNVTATEAVFGNIRALTGVMDMLGANVEGTRQIFANMESSTGTLAGAFAVVTETLNFQLSQLWSNLAGLGIEIGTILLPSVKEFVGALSGIVGWVRELSPEVQNWAIAVGFVAAALGPLLVFLGTLVTWLPFLVSGIGLVAGALGVGLLPVVAVGGALLLGLSALSALFLKNKLDAWAAAKAVDEYKASLATMNREQLEEQKTALLGQVREIQGEVDRYSRTRESYAGAGNQKMVGIFDKKIAEAKGRLHEVKSVGLEVTQRLRKMDAAKPDTSPSAPVIPTIPGLPGLRPVEPSIAELLARFDKPAPAAQLAGAKVPVVGMQLAPISGPPSAPVSLPSPWQLARDGAAQRMSEGVADARFENTQEAAELVQHTKDPALSLALGFEEVKMAGLGLAMQFTPMALLMDVLSSIMEPLLPVIESLKEPLRVVGLIFGQMLAPILMAFLPLIKLTAIAFTYVAQIFGYVGGVIAHIVGGIATFVGNVIAAIGGALRKIPFLGKIGKTLQSVGNGITDFGRGLRGAGDELFGMANAMPAARDEINGLGTDAADALDGTADAADGLTESLTSALTNVPEGFRVFNAALARFNSTLPADIAGPGSGVSVTQPITQPIGPAPANTGSQTTAVNFGDIYIDGADKDGGELWREIKREIQKDLLLRTGNAHGPLLV